jgi:glycosyltransferase involved in cell wall biosynthesis
LKILQMTHQGDYGGSTNSITWLTRGLAERGHDVTLACRPQSLIATRFAGSSVRLVNLELPRGPRLFAQTWKWRRWIEENGIDVVNAHASLDRHLVSYLRCLGVRSALVHTRRNVSLSTGGRARAWFDTATTDAIIAVSQGVGRDLERRGIPPDHVHVIHNGLPLRELAAGDPARAARVREELHLAPGIPVIGVVARRKAQEDLLRAAFRLRRPLEILFAGVNGDESLARLAAGLPEGTHAHFLGFRNDVPDLSALFDVFVLPSEIEGFSLALLEAMARGIPCIATDAGGNREALEGESGVIVPARDPAALADAIARLLDAPDEARRLGERGRARAYEEFDVARTVERTESLYRDLLAARRS